MDEDDFDEGQVIILIGEYRRFKAENAIMPYHLEMIEAGMMRALEKDPISQIPRVLEDARELIQPLRW